MSADLAARANPPLARLAAYDPGHDLEALRTRFGADLAELGANENPDGPAPAARAALREALAGIHRYPDPRAGRLRAALAEALPAATDELVFGNGSHELLMQLGQAFAGPGRPVVYSRYGFAVYALAAAAVGAPAIAVEALGREHPQAPLGHDLDAIARAVTAETRLVFLANPNNPTGTWFEQSALRRLLEAVPDEVLVVVDEAYVEYHRHDGGASALELRAHFPNLVVVRTFSKAHALAGLRVGYLVADPGVCRVLEGLRENFNVGVLAQAAACASLTEPAWLARSVARNHGARRQLREALARRGLPSLPSRTNFLLVDCDSQAAAIEQRLREAGVVVRPVTPYGLPGYLRISVGSAADNRRLLAALA